MNRRVVVTGVGLVTPIATTTEASWEGLMNAKSGIKSYPEWETECPGLAVTIAGGVEPFDHRPYWRSDEEGKSHDRYMAYALRASDQAFKMAGIDTRVDDNVAHRAACIMGVGLAGYYKVLDTYENLITTGPDAVDPAVLFNVSNNMVPAAMARRHNLWGTNYTAVSACTSGAHAVGEAYLQIKHGRADFALTGGCEAGVQVLTTSGFAAMRALTSSHNHEPEKASRPFEKTRDGFVLAEGAGALVLEEFEAAKARGADIICEIRGYGASEDANHITAPAAEGEGAQRSMRSALAMAGMRPDEIGYINAHGTSTPLNDVNEGKAIRHVFGDWADNGLMVSSTKSMTGHLLGGAGGVEAVISALALKRGQIPPTINYDEPDPEIVLDLVPHEGREKHVKAVVSNAFGFGGTNGSLLLTTLDA